MAGLVWFLILSIIYIIMMSIMIIFERDKPRNIIIYTALFLFTQIVGYCIYLISRLFLNKKKASLQTKNIEDEIYVNLSKKALKEVDVNSNCDIVNFNKLAFNANLTVNNNYEIITSYKKLKDSICADIKKASHYILLELTKVNKQDFEPIKNALIEKAKEGVIVKFVHDKFINLRLKKELKSKGVKVYKFSKFNTIGNIYENNRDIISIDGNVAYLSNFNIKKRQINSKFEIMDCFIKLKGDILQSINLELHKDTIFASGKYIEYKKQVANELSNACEMQYVSNQFEKDLELLIIKAISLSKKSIQLQLKEFIPTESIMSLLNFAINSNIQVKLMVPLKSNGHSKFYATRAYSKELALLGANVYLYDGYIRFNAITIDDEYVLTGSYKMDREHIGSALQNVILIKDGKAVASLNKLFENGINNSYRINNAKYMLLREKFFKNFV